MTTYDAVVIGTGPNGLAAAITLAQAGRKVLALEAKGTPGGGMRTLELTLPGFRHDICSAVHPLGIASPFFSRLPLAHYGLRWVHPKIELAHPLDNSPAVLVERSVNATAAGLGRDRGAYQRLFAPLVRGYQEVLNQFLAPLQPPRQPLMMMTFGLPALLSARRLAKVCFREQRAQALFAGCAAHAIQPLEYPLTGAFGLMLGMLAHAVGWVLAEGGSQSIADALSAHFQSLGGEITTGIRVEQMRDLPFAHAYLFDLTPRQLLRIVGERLPANYRRRLEGYRYGPGVFKIDYALSAPIPWQDQAVSQAATVHLGGTLEEISHSEREVFAGHHPERPYVLLVQPTLIDPSRAPAGKHIAWAYCHVPHGSTVDMTSALEAQIERFAPGFGEVVLARCAHHALDMEVYNPNYVGGDINGGIQDLRQLFTRPVPCFNPYTTPAQDIYLCSSSTPPGGGVHGMCGYFAARAVLKRWNGGPPSGKNRLY